MIIGPFDSSGSLYYNYSQLPKEYHVASMEWKAQKKWALHHQSKLLFRRERQSPFLRLCVVGIRSPKILLGDGVPTDKIAFTEKLV